MRPQATACWTGGGWRVLAAAAALLSCALVIAVHHLGYRGFRVREMVFQVVGCLVLSLAFLLTTSPIAAVGGTSSSMSRSCGGVSNDRRI
jgi:hypothetical protein